MLGMDSKQRRYLVALFMFECFSIVDSQLKALWNLNEMAECRLSYSAIYYNNYGCWCGVGGAGKPMDGIDDCCMRHDKCYDAAISSGACPNVPVEYIEDYTWVCNRTEDQRPEPVCTESTNKCKNLMCWCDKMVVDCWSQFKKPASKKKCSHGLIDSVAKSFFSALQ